MPLHPFWVTPAITLLAAGIVLADTNRRKLAPRTRLFWTAGVGLTSLGVFIGVFMFQRYVYEFYYRVTGQHVITHTPYELVLNSFIAGLLLTAIAVLTYGFGSRFGPFKAEEHSQM